MADKSNLSNGTSNRVRSWSLPGLNIEMMRRSSVGAQDAPTSPAPIHNGNNPMSSPRPTENESPSNTPDSFIRTSCTPDQFVRPRVKGINPDLLTFLNSPF